MALCTPYGGEKFVLAAVAVGGEGRTHVQMKDIPRALVPLPVFCDPALHAARPVPLGPLPHGVRGETLDPLSDGEQPAGQGDGAEPQGRRKGIIRRVGGAGSYARVHA